MKKENGYSLLVGGSGMVHINTGLSRLGFDFVAGQNPERLLGCVKSSRFHGAILADNLAPDTTWPDRRSSHQRLLDLLAEMEKAKSHESQKVWLITRQKPAEAWTLYASFGMVHEIRRVINPVMLASDILNWLKVNYPLPNGKKAKLAVNE